MPDENRPSRPRPSYGLPGPEPRPGSETPAAAQDGDPRRDASPAPAGPAPSAADTGWGQVPTGSRSAGPDAAAPRRRRGLVPLLIGLGSLLLGAIALVTGLVIGVSSVGGAVSTGLQPFGGTTTTISARSSQMYIVYVPAQDEAATCTAEGADPSAVQVVPTSGQGNIGPGGEPYAQKIGVVTSADTDVTVTCSVATAAYLGPVNPWAMVTPILIGLGLSLLLGITGVVLTILGIVRLVRSRR